MTKKNRTDHDLLVCIDQKTSQHGRDILDLKQHFENHLNEHKRDLSEKLEHYWSMKLLIISVCITTLGTLIVGIISLIR